MLNNKFGLITPFLTGNLNIFVFLEILKYKTIAMRSSNVPMNMNKKTFITNKDKKEIVDFYMAKKNSAIKLLINLLIVFFVFGCTSGKKHSPDVLQSMETLSADELYAYVDTLSSDRFEGRLSGHEGYDKAAEWVVKKFKEWGVQPVNDEIGYLQKFAHPYTDVFEGSVVQMIDEDGQVIKNYEYVEEFIPGSTSGNGQVDAEVVYVGYGITAPELGYDDYANVDVQDKIVLMEREVPVNAGHENFIDWRPYSFHQYKLINAYKHGAAGFLYNYHIGNPNNAYIEDLILSYVGDKVVADIFEGTGFKHEDLVQKIDSLLKPQSFNTNKRFSVKNNTKHHPEGVTSNVIGFIEGSDPELKDEYIILGGHLDFLGRCYEIMPGANDNASAVSINLSLARALSDENIKLKRSVLFLMFGAEEAAIKGAQYFLKNPPVPVDQMVALLNMDGVGIGDKIWTGFAENYPDLYDYIEEANANYVEANLKGGYVNNITRPRLDAAFFDWYGIPSLSFSAYGDLPQNKAYRYHTTYDNIDNITPEIMESLSKILFLSVIDMANDENLNLKRGEQKTEFIEEYDFYSIVEKNLN